MDKKPEVGKKAWTAFEKKLQSGDFEMAFIIASKSEIFDGTFEEYIRSRTRNGYLQKLYRDWMEDESNKDLIKKLAKVIIRDFSKILTIKESVVLKRSDLKQIIREVILENSSEIRRKEMDVLANEAEASAKRIKELLKKIIAKFNPANYKIVAK